MISINKLRIACLGILLAAASVCTERAADASCGWNPCAATNPQTHNCSTTCTNGSAISWTSLWEYDPDFSEYIAQNNVTSFTNDAYGGYYQDEWWHCANSGWHEPSYQGPFTSNNSIPGTCVAGDTMDESYAQVYIN